MPMHEVNWRRLIYIWCWTYGPMYRYLHTIPHTHKHSSMYIFIEYDTHTHKPMNYKLHQHTLTICWHPLLWCAYQIPTEYTERVSRVVATHNHTTAEQRHTNTKTHRQVDPVETFLLWIVIINNKHIFIMWKIINRKSCASILCFFIVIS